MAAVAETGRHDPRCLTYAERPRIAGGLTRGMGSG